MLIRALVCKFLCGYMFFIFLGIFLQVGHLGCMFNFLKNYQTIFKVAAAFYNPTCNESGFQLLHILEDTCRLFGFAILRGNEVVVDCGFHLHFCNVPQSWESFQVFIGHLYGFLREKFIQILSHL